MKTKKKKFDSVKMMRDIRDKLGEKYLKNPGLEKRDLIRIRKQYGIKASKLNKVRAK